MSTREPWRYEKLTWPEINQAVQATKVVVVPIGSIEQHGPHLPLDVDVVCPVGVAHHAARLIPDQVLIMPPIIHGYTAHVMDFPGTINIHYEHFIRMVMDVGKSLAYHGFKKIILLNGHGSNWPNLDLASRRINLETDAECSAVCWWSLITIDQGVLRSRGGRASFPAVALMQESWKPPRTCISTKKTSGKTRLPMEKSNTTGPTPTSSGPIFLRPDRLPLLLGRPAIPTAAYWATPHWRPRKKAGGQSWNRPGSWRAGSKSSGRHRSRHEATTTIPNRRSTMPWNQPEPPTREW